MKTSACPKILSLVLGATLAAGLSLATPGIAQDRFIGVIPEPESCAMFLAGLGLIGLTGRRGGLLHRA
jgi:hypothetical protein